MIDFRITASHLETTGLLCSAALVAFILFKPVQAGLKRQVARLPISSAFVLVLCIAVAIVVCGTKTNAPPRLVWMPSRSGGGPDMMVTPEDIARGYRVSLTATNETFSFEMPSNATVVGNWHKRGTFGEWMRLELGDFEFPLGSNDAVFSSFSVFNDGKIRPKPRDLEHEICAVGVPMLAMQGASRFWTKDEADGSKTLTWENFFLHADTSMPVNAQIRLWRSGDFLTRSNAVETAYSRINPHDWDGDGIANGKDADSAICDGDFFGVANQLPTNANPNAYYRLDLAATGALGVANIKIVCDGPSDLGNHDIIARINQVCHVPLLAGATYTVESDLPFSYSAVSSEYAQIETNAGNSLTVVLPLEFSFERVQMRNAGAVNYAVHSSPLDVVSEIVDISGGCCECTANGGGFTWSCVQQCFCGGSLHQFYAGAEWEGYLSGFSWIGRCNCYWENRQAIDEMENRGFSLEILNSSGNSIDWENPVLVGESIIVKATVGGGILDTAEFAGLFAGRLSVKSYYADGGGSHDIAGGAIPFDASNVSAAGLNVFHVSVSAVWLQSEGIVRNTEDGIVAKTSMDMSAEPNGDSNRQDSDIFDQSAGGRLYGRARGVGEGNPYAAIPEGALNRKTIQAGGMASLVAFAGDISSPSVLCQQQADVIYYSGHGSHDTAQLCGVAWPSDISNRWHDVDTVAIAGCSVLDIDNIAGRVDPDRADPAASPGRKWFAASGANILLGYCWTAPLDSRGGTDIAAEWCANRQSAGDVEAWMQANDCRSGHNACAIKKLTDSSVEYHYFQKRARVYWTRKSQTVNLEAR